MIRMVSTTETWVSTSHLVKRSSAKTSAAAPYALARRSAIQNLTHGFCTGSTDRRERSVAADVVSVLPAALALGSIGAQHFYREIARAFLHLHLRGNEQPRQFTGVLEQ